MKQSISFIFVFMMMSFSAFPQSWQVTSPDGSLTLRATLTDQIYVSIWQGEEMLMWDSPFSIDLDNGMALGKQTKVTGTQERSVDHIIEPVWGIRSRIRDHYKELELQFEGDYSLILRAYDEGVAWRYETNLPERITVLNEQFLMRFRNNHALMAQVYDGVQTSYERPYTRYAINEVKEDEYLALPLLIDQGNRKLVFTESDLRDYPGMYLRRQGQNNRHELYAELPAAPSVVAQSGWSQFNMRVTARAPWLAKTNGKRNFPWRVMIVASDDKELADSDLVYKLASSPEIVTDWIRPGKVAWDWWNAWNLQGVDFETGVNNRTYEYYVDFAAANGLEYIIMDEGWSDPFDLFLLTPEIDVKYITDYAAERNVKVILWCVWHTLDRQMEAALDQFEAWGVAGIKVDFIDRDDQDAINFYEHLAREAAKRKLLVDYHGCSKPTGLSRTFPNIINYEGVMGNEYNKFSTSTSPGHDVDIVFTRMIAGPMDYTPGAMRNSTRGNFHVDNENPMSPGTRCHQMGMYVVYYSPLQMLCDAPTAYEQEPEVLEMTASVPTSWDETKVLAAEVGEYVVIARRKGEAWYIGAINNWTEREIQIPLGFLGAGRYDARFLVDGVNANRKATDYRMVDVTVTSSSALNLVLKQGGGMLGRMEMGE